MVPFWQMQRLLQHARSKHTEWVEFPDSQHMDAYEANAEIYW